MRKQTVSVVVPSYNAGEYLAYTLESIEKQTFEAFECIVVDDSSTDGSLSVARSFARRDRRFRVIEHRANSGLSASRNTGLRAARAPYVCFLDADDLMMRRSLELRVKYLASAQHPLVAGTFCHSKTIYPDAKAPPNEEAHAATNVVDFVVSAGNCPFNANQPMLRTEVIRGLGGFDETLPTAEDYDLWMRVFRAGFFFVRTPFSAVTYRQRPGSLVRLAPGGHLDISTELQGQAYSTIRPDRAYRAAPNFLCKDWPTYKRQCDASKRVLEFVGMGLARGVSVEEAAQRVASALPDIEQVVSMHFDCREVIANGMRRYYAVPPKKILAPRTFTRDAETLLAGAYAAAREAKRGEPVSVDGAEIPARLMWNPQKQRAVDAFFVPHRDYHVWTASLIKPGLEAAGLNVGVVDISAQYRDEGVRDAASKHGAELIGYGNFALGDFDPRAIVVFNDWDPIVRGIVCAAQDAGVRTIGVVEGIQDYEDRDTGRIREPYRSTDVVILPGEFDRQYFKGSAQATYVGGVPRVAELRRGPRANGGDYVLINSNFSYGVLEDCRDDWLTAAVEACQVAGLPCRISRHRADKGKLFPELLTRESFYDATRGASVVVQRFASGMLEALAMGVPVVYFNPHGEKVDKFAEPMGAYEVVTEAGDLARAILSPIRDQQAWDAFLDAHAGGQGDPTRRLAEIIADEIRKAPAAEEGAFKANLAALDRASSALTEVPALSAMFAPRYGRDAKALRNGEAWAQARKRGAVELSLPPVPPNDAMLSRPLVGGSLFSRRLRKLLRDPKMYLRDSRYGILRSLVK